ncbi:MAG: response regulator [Hyphomicrobiaceae bacterium]|nr:response regulator [Hyphomicrobiaceae bacterium]
MARILLADDDRGALDLVRRALETDGHVVTAVGDGNDALAALKTSAFDVLVADVEMPGIDGVELARRARAVATGIRIVFISGSEELLERARSLVIVGARTLSKPFSIDRIRSEVRAALE